MILCCGEALIDMLPRETREGEAAFAPYSGGAIFNTAIALGRLGAPAGLFSGISTDMFGRQLIADLEASRVDAGFVVRSPRPTTLAFVRLEDGQAQYLFYDESSAGRMLSAADLPELPQSVAALHFGAISLCVEPCGTAYEALMAEAAASRVISLDPNIRKDFIADRDAHLARMRRMIAMADIVKLSDEDLDWFGFDGSHDDAAASLLDAGPKLVVVTRGAKGATAWTASGKTEVGGAAVAVVDTVGAGDTFNAGILAGLHRAGRLSKPAIAELSRDDVRAALELATRAAAVTVSRAGANPPWAHEVEPA